MYVADYNFEIPEDNILVKQQDIFQNKLTIKSVHCYYETATCYKYTREWTDNKGKTHYSFERGLSNGSICCSPHSEVPIDIVYKSSPQGEDVFITLWGDATSNRLIFNIDGKINIDLIRQEDIQENFGSREWSSEAYDTAIGEQRYNKEKQRYYQQRGTGYDRLFFEITREQLEKLCYAKTLSIQSSSESNEVQFEGDASGFITILQALYNEAFDNSMYTDAKDKALSFIESDAANIEANNNAEASKVKNFYKRRTVLIVGLGIFVIIVLIYFFIIKPFYY